MTLSLSSVHDHLSRHHASSINDRARFDIRLSTSTYLPPSKTGNRQLGPRPAASPLASQPYDPVWAVPMAGLGFRLTGNSTQPRPRPHHGNQSITGKNMCDDVSVNKSLYGNERETPSTRSPGHPRPGRDGCGHRVGARAAPTRPHVGADEAARRSLAATTGRRPADTARGGYSMSRQPSHRPTRDRRAPSSGGP